MLTVIFGAGASYDSSTDYPPDRSSSDIDGQRLPLANQLFSPVYGSIAKNYPTILAILPQLRRASSNIEDELEIISKRQSGYIKVHAQLLGVRSYLYKLIGTVQAGWSGRISDTTTYLPLLDAIDRWKVGLKKEKNLTTFITFNYDTMLDIACRTVLKKDITTINSYITDSSGYTLLRPHGSIEWERLVTYVPDNGRSAMDNADKLHWTDKFVIIGEPKSRNEGQDYVPAIAIPTTTKDKFEMPNAHLTHMIDVINRTTTLLLIGWRASEMHFLKLWKENATSGTLKMIQIVNTDPIHASEIFGRLRDFGGITCSNVSYSYKGFSGFIEKDMDDFLATAALSEF